MGFVQDAIVRKLCDHGNVICMIFGCRIALRVELARMVMVRPIRSQHAQHRSPNTLHDFPMSTLAELAPGSRGRITAITLPPAERQRLLELGVTLGSEVNVVRVAPLGDPIEIKVRGYLLSLRKADAAQVTLDPIEAKA